jgi:glycerol-3-phosphate acyltransferase PlsX
VVEGTLQAARQHRSITLTLVGDEAEITREIHARLRQRDPFPANLRLCHAPGVLTMRDGISRSRLTDPSYSLVQAIQLVAADQAQACISPGNTKLVYAIAKLHLGLQEAGIRPAIGVTLPTLQGKALLVDAGATVDSTPEELAQFARLGVAYLQATGKILTPRLGLLSNGTEEGKGNSVVKTTHRLLEDRYGPQYVGQVQGCEFFLDNHVDLLVADGFVGNVFLKSAESGAMLAFLKMREAAGKSLRATVGAWLLQPSLREVRREVDPNQNSGAPILGLRRLCMVCHGHSGATSIARTIADTIHSLQQSPPLLVAASAP